MSPGQVAERELGAGCGGGGSRQRGACGASAAASRQPDLKMKTPIDLTVVWALLDRE